jgi:hypothetical protein
MNKGKLADLDQFYGTEQWHRFMPRILLSDGVKFLCENADCYWLMDIIWSYQPKFVRGSEEWAFQIWRLRSGPAPKEMKGTMSNERLDDAVAYVTCEYDTNKVLILQEISYTDFPFDVLKEAKIYVGNGERLESLVCLPAER